MVCNTNVCVNVQIVYVYLVVILMGVHTLNVHAILMGMYQGGK